MQLSSPYLYVEEKILNLLFHTTMATISIIIAMTITATKMRIVVVGPTPPISAMYTVKKC